VNKATTFLYEGIYNELTGNLPRAHANWKKCIELAEQYRQPYELGRANYEIGQHLNDPERSMRMKKACEIFEDLHTPYELELVKTALEQSTSASMG
jgi:hypothetical protein